MTGVQRQLDDMDAQVAETARIVKERDLTLYGSAGAPGQIHKMAADIEQLRSDVGEPGELQSRLRDSDELVRANTAKIETVERVEKEPAGEAVVVQLVKVFATPAGAVIVGAMVLAFLAALAIMSGIANGKATDVRDVPRVPVIGEP